MPEAPESWTVPRATLGGLARRNIPADDPRWEQARRDLKVAKLADHIAEVVATAPPLRPEDLDRLRALLPPVPCEHRDGGEPDAA